MTRSTGARYERELINIFDDAGYAALRVPSSGSATERELPDLHVGNGEHTLAIEAKYCSGDRVYLKPEKINGLCWFSDRYNSVPLVAGRWSQDTTWYFERPSELHMTDNGKYRIKRSDQQSGAITIDEVLDGSVRFDEATGLIADGGVSRSKTDWDAVAKRVLDECERLVERNVADETYTTVKRLRSGGFHPHAHGGGLGESGRVVSEALSRIIDGRVDDEITDGYDIEIEIDKKTSPYRYRIRRVGEEISVEGDYE